MVLLLGVDQGPALEPRVIRSRLQLVEKVDHVLLGHVQRDAFGFGHLLQLDHGEVVQPSGRLDFLELLGELLRLFEGCLLLGEELNQAVLGTEQADLVFLELGAERGLGKGAKVRITVLPGSLKMPFHEQKKKLRATHERDLADG